MHFIYIITNVHRYFMHCMIDSIPCIPQLRYLLNGLGQRIPAKCRISRISHTSDVQDRLHCTDYTVLVTLYHSLYILTQVLDSPSEARPEPRPALIPVALVADVDH